MNILIADDEVTAIRDLTRVIKKVEPDAKIKSVDDANLVLPILKEQRFDVAFLDIMMPDKDGLTLAKEIKTVDPMINIVMVTSYSQYALDALKLYVSDYILKPASPEDIRKALSNLRNPVLHSRKGLYIKCFGNFEVFYDAVPIRFGRAKSKELLAYLVDRKGSSVTNAELRALLWEDKTMDTEKQMKYLAQIVYQLRSCLEEYGASDILIQSRDSYAINTEKIVCDYYLALQRDAQALSSYNGEYMSQYEWAMFHSSSVNKELTRSGD